MFDSNAQKRFPFALSAILFLCFLLFTLLVKTVDVAPVGPLGSEIGFSSLNRAAFDALGVSVIFYEITEDIGLFAIALAAGEMLALGVSFWKKKQLDRELFLLAATYVLLGILYVAFEFLAVNYRPLLVGDALEASFPSSHTMLAVTIFLTSLTLLRKKFRGPKDRAIRIAFSIALPGISLFMAFGRLLSGVHWLTDIFGGLLLGVALSAFYCDLLSSNLLRKSEPL